MIRVVIAEDQKMLLGALAALLEMEGDIRVVGRAGNGEEAVKLVREHRPDVCVMDIEMPGMSGLEAAEQLKDTGVKVIILTTFARPGYFERAVKAGVRGYLLKDSPSEELAEAIRSVAAGKKVFASELVDFAFQEENPLTEREHEVLMLLAEGKSTKEISSMLYLSNGTVRNYISAILDKLNVGNRIEAIKRFREKGWFK
jgi:two-component system response regulator DesR